MGREDTGETPGAGNQGKGTRGRDIKVGTPQPPQLPLSGQRGPCEEAAGSLFPKSAPGLCPSPPPPQPVSPFPSRGGADGSGTITMAGPPPLLWSSGSDAAERQRVPSAVPEEPEPPRRSRVRAPVAGSGEGKSVRVALIVVVGAVFC